jgi:ribosomal protein L31
MKTSARLTLAITALALTGVSHAGPTLFDRDMSVYFEDKGTGAALYFSSSRHDTENHKSSFFSWIDRERQYYSCTSKDSALNIPPKAKTGSVVVTVDSTWSCSPQNTPLPLALRIECKADGLNHGTGTGKSRRMSNTGVQRFKDRYNSNSANCQISVNGAAPITTQGWLLNKQNKRVK